MPTQQYVIYTSDNDDPDDGGVYTFDKVAPDLEAAIGAVKIGLATGRGCAGVAGQQ